MTAEKRSVYVRTFEILTFAIRCMPFRNSGSEYPLAAWKLDKNRIAILEESQERLHERAAEINADMLGTMPIARKGSPCV
jgi:hypothetical protein